MTYDEQSEILSNVCESIRFRREARLQTWLPKTLHHKNKYGILVEFKIIQIARHEKTTRYKDCMFYRSFDDYLQFRLNQILRAFDPMLACVIVSNKQTMRAMTEELRYFEEFKEYDTDTRG